MTKAQTLVLIQFTLFGLIGASALLIPTERSNIQWVIGVSATIAGLIFALVAIGEHGRVNHGGPSAFPIPRQHADLITSGLYKYIRHPIYTGVLLAAFGISVWHGHILTLLLSIVLVGLLTYKSMYEESLLRGQYPDYPAYMQSAGRFFPKIFK